MAELTVELTLWSRGCIRRDRSYGILSFLTHPRSQRLHSQYRNWTGIPLDTLKLYALPAFTTAAALLTSLSAAALLTKRDSLGSPFNLTINSADGSIVEYKLGACHSQAGGEVLCAYPGVNPIFNFNSSTGYDETGDGYLVYLLEANPSPVYQNAVLGQTVNNVAYMSFGYEAAPGFPSEFAFEEDTLAAVTDQTSGGSNLTDPHFWLCNYSNYGGYNYNVVAYTLDDAEPQADNCTAVSVNRRTSEA